MKKVFIVDAKRTAIGGFCGTLSKIKPQDLTTSLISAITSKYENLAQYIDHVILGQVLTAGFGQNPARQAAYNAGVYAPAYTVNQVCGSGLRAICAAVQEIQNGENLIIAGGQENMSLCPHFINLRVQKKFGNTELTDSILHDGLTDAFYSYHMGITAENLVKKFNISREEQDLWAYNSHMKACSATESKKFTNEILPINVNGVSFFKDEGIRADTNIEKLNSLKAVFEKNGSVTAGNSSTMNDGSAIVLLASEKGLQDFKLQPMAVIETFADAVVEADIMGIGAAEAAKKALNLAKWNVDDLDLIELNEAFASQVLSVNKIMHWDTNKVNVNGGAIALGHPIGASGARCLVSLVHEMKKRAAKKGLVTLCIGGGMGIAACISIL